MMTVRHVSLEGHRRYRALYTVKKCPPVYTWWSDGYDTYRAAPTERCANCGRKFCWVMATDEMPHYCTRCRLRVFNLWRGKYWDDGEDIPF